MEWWEWFKLLGALGLLALLPLLTLGASVPPLIVAAALHLAFDFTFQSGETAARKGERGRHLFVHALCAGALPHAVAGILTGNPSLVLVWASIGFISHFGIDWTRKFGVQSVALSATLDQAAHLLVLVLTMA
jgi:hypothetical protein